MKNHVSNHVLQYFDFILLILSVLLISVFSIFL